MKKTALIVLSVCLLLLIVYFSWYLSGRVISAKLTLAQPSQISAYGSNTGHGNIVAIQPLLLTTDYASEDRFYTVLNSYFAISQQKGWLTPKTVVALPEFVGTWLIAAGEKEAVYKASNLTDGMKPLILCHLFPFIKEYISAKKTKYAQDILKYSIFMLKAKTSARIYQDVFSRLAKQYGVTVVAGSTVLPSPHTNKGKLEIGNGNLYNVSVVYKPDGLAYDKPVLKSFLTNIEIPFETRGLVSKIPVFQTPAGRLGILICADAWFPDAYRVLMKQHVEILVVPSYKALESKLINPWGGYEGAPPPDDVNRADVHKITEEDALYKYAMVGRINSSGAKYGVNVFLRGDFWGMGSDGYTMIMNQGKFIKGDLVKGSTILNLWL